MSDDVINAVIIDDEDTAIDNLRFGLKRYGHVQVVGVAKNGASGIRMVKKERPDVVFLDVELPDATGMDIAVRIRDMADWKIHIVFYTAYNKYLIDALRNHVFDFMLKPIDLKELDVVMNRVLSVISSESEDDKEEPEVMPEKYASREEKSFMIVMPTGDIRILRTSDIGYFRYLSGRKIWEAALSNGTFVPLKRNTTAESLCTYDSSFVQIHQSYIVNMNYLLIVHDNRCIMYPPFEKVTELRVSKKYRKIMMGKFFQL